MVGRAIEVAKELEKKQIKAEVINVRFLKPLDEATILKSIQKTQKVITIEDNILTGGLASHIEHLLIKNELGDVQCKSFGWKKSFIEHGKVEELEKLYGLDVENIVNYITGTEQKI